jgi:hypothetical protein
MEKESKKQEEVSYSQERVKDLGGPTKEVGFSEWKEIISENFPELLLASEISLSIVAQILIKDVSNPFALVLIDAPSAGKTTVANFFANIEGLSYATDKFTPASFVSNAANVKKKELEKIDLLPRIRYKLLIVRDLGTIFSKRDDDVKESLGLLTRALDGEGLSTDSGIHGHRGYDGEYLFMLLAATTPFKKAIWNIMGNLGSRLFFLRPNVKSKTEKELTNQLKDPVVYKKKVLCCRKATENIIKSLWADFPKGVEWNNTEEEDEVLEKISRCAKLLAKLRSSLRIKNIKDLMPFDEIILNHTGLITEKPDRINQLLYNLARGHTLINNRRKINADDLRIVIELTIDSAPDRRSILFRKLLKSNGVMATSEVEKALKCSKPTALAEMKILEIIGVCYMKSESKGRVGEPEKELCLLSEFEWFTSDECKRIRGLEVDPSQETIPGMDNQ